jgi:hypothetical protein
MLAARNAFGMGETIAKLFSAFEITKLALFSIFS